MVRHRPSAERGRKRTLVLDMCVEGGAADAALQPPGVRIESLESVQLLRTTQVRLTHCVLEYSQCLVVDLERYGKRMPVFTAVCE